MRKEGRVAEWRRLHHKVAVGVKAFSKAGRIFYLAQSGPYQMKKTQKGVETVPTMVAVKC